MSLRCSLRPWAEIEVLPPRQGPIHKGCLLVPGGVEHIVDDEAKHLVYLYAGLCEMLRQSSTDATARTGRDFVYCSMCRSYHYAFTQRQCLTPDTVWYLATVPFPQAGMPLPGCEALAADCWPAPVFLALADIVVAPNANAVTKIPINSFDVDTRLSSDCFAFSNHLTSALFRGSCLELCPVQRDVFISKHHRSSNISLQSTAETSRHSGCGILPAPRI